MHKIIKNSAEICDLNEVIEAGESAKIIIVDVDKDNVDCNINIDIKERANLELKIASYSKNNEKNYNIRVNNNGYASFSNIECYAIANDNSKITLNVSNYVPKGSHASEVKQKLKTLNIGTKVNVTANPILLIDELDCFASHAATNSKINNEELFYLETRGINEIKAKELITVANLTSVLKDEDENLIADITEKILEVYND